MMDATAATANPDNADASFDDMLDEALQHACGERSVEDDAALRRWLGTLYDYDAACAMTAVVLLPSLLEQLSVEAVGRWLLTGVRLYPNEPARRQRYFQMLDARAVETIEREASAPSLTASIPSLTLLLEALSERLVHIQAQRFDALAAVPQRPILTSTHLLLPADYTALDAGDPWRLFRASAAHAVAHLRHSPAALPVKTLKPMSLAVISAVEDARVERLLIRDFPGIRAWFVPLLESSLQAEGLSFPALISRMNYALMEPGYSDDNYWVNKARTLFEARAAVLNDYAAFREIASILANDLGQMRVRFHPQQYVVPAPYRDDNTFLWTYPDAEPPEQSCHLHSESPVAAVSQQRDARDTGEKRWEEPETQRVQYPEWDYRLGLLRSLWCTVIERTSQRHSDSGAPARRGWPTHLKLPAHTSLTRNARLRRQAEGEELDLDAAIEHTIDRRRGHSPEHRVFTRPGTKLQTMSLLLLLDLSASSGERIGASGMSILDIEKDAALMLAHAAIAAGHRIAVHGFASNTRECVNYYRLLDFGAPLDEARETAIRAAVPRYSTRMGAAIRHAATMMSNETVDRRAIIVITDGAPSDIDVYDAQYLVHDAQTAATDARRAGIMTGGLTVDAGSADYMRRIVGREHCRVVSDPHALSIQLAALYARLAQ